MSCVFLATFLRVETLACQLKLILPVAILAIGISGCSPLEKYQTEDVEIERDFRKPEGSIRDMLSKESDMSSAEWAPNLYLWQASISTLGFMGFKLIDPERGVVTTEWFDSLGNEYQTTVIISGSQLLSYNVSVQVATRSSNEKGQTSSVSREMETQLKDSILLKAKELRQKDVS